MSLELPMRSQVVPNLPQKTLCVPEGTARFREMTPRIPEIASVFRENILFVCF
jgi:hypothetical protein